MPVSVANQVLIFFAAISGLSDSVPVEKMREFENGLNEYAANNAEEILNEITEKKVLTDELEKTMKKLIEDYKSTLDYIEK